MPNNDRILLNRILGSRTVAYKPYLAHLLEDPLAALYLSQLLWHDGDGRQTGEPGEPFHVPTELLQEETGISIKSQRRIRKALIDKRLITAERRSSPARYFYTVSIDNLAALAAGQLELGLPAESTDGTLKSRPSGQSRVSQRSSLELPEGALSNRKEQESQKNGKKNLPRKHAADYFEKRTHLPQPKPTTEKARRSAGEFWCRRRDHGT